MHQIKRVIELHLQGRSIRQIGRLTGISRNTIRDYLRRMALSGRPLEELLKLEDGVLAGIAQVDLKAIPKLSRSKKGDLN